MFRAGVSRAIDLMHLGRDRVICAFEVDGLVIDPGPALCVKTLLDGLSDEPRAVLLTHVHLDHAGAAGVLARRFPELDIYVHGAGARHIADPTRLLRSARRLYGDDMDRLWGEIAPVPEERVRPLEGGETVEGFRVAYTPGHASHHVCYLHESTGDAYVGDVAGVRIEPEQYTIAPTPPPEIDVNVWLESVEVLEEWSPEALCLTHFGRFEDVDDQLERIREALARWASETLEHDQDTFPRALEEELRSAVRPESVPSYLQAAPPDQQWLGLERYWRKRLGRSPVAQRGWRRLLGRRETV
jgi:glyoxylase-like metal-dependent hydrolase (beta-lactamase superfamily II)